MMAGELVRAGRKENFYTDRMDIIINPSDICNFDCSYCINKKSRSSRILPKELVVNLIDDLGARKHEEYLIQLTGGEPLLYPYAQNVLNAMNTRLPAKNKTLLFVTNGFYLNDRGVAFLKNSGETNVRFWLSLHLEQMDADKYMDIILSFPEPEFLFVSMLFSPAKLEIYKKITEALSSASIDFTCTAIVDSTGNTVKYSHEELQFLETIPYNSKELFFHEYASPVSTELPLTNMDKKFKHSIFNYENYFCSAGRNTLRIDPGANLIRCFGFLKQGQKYNLYNTRLRDIHELNKPCICPVKYCGQCDLFLNTPKWSSEEYAPVYLQKP